CSRCAAVATRPYARLPWGAMCVSLNCTSRWGGAGTGIEPFLQDGNGTPVCLDQVAGRRRLPLIPPAGLTRLTGFGAAKETAYVVYTQSTPSMIKALPLSNRAYEQLRDAILDGELRPGEALFEIHLRSEEHTSELQS